MYQQEKASLEVLRMILTLFSLNGALNSLLVDYNAGTPIVSIVASTTDYRMSSWICS
jgi:hypothetical protein